MRIDLQEELYSVFERATNLQQIHSISEIRCTEDEEVEGDEKTAQRRELLVSTFVWVMIASSSRGARSIVVAAPFCEIVSIVSTVATFFLLRSRPTNKQDVILTVVESPMAQQDSCSSTSTSW